MTYTCLASAWASLQKLTEPPDCCPRRESLTSLAGSARAHVDHDRLGREPRAKSREPRVERAKVHRLMNSAPAKLGQPVVRRQPSMQVRLRSCLLELAIPSFAVLAIDVIVALWWANCASLGTGGDSGQNTTAVR